MFVRRHVRTTRITNVHSPQLVTSTCWFRREWSLLFAGERLLLRVFANSEQSIANSENSLVLSSLSKPSIATHHSDQYELSANSPLWFPIHQYPLNDSAHQCPFTNVRSTMSGLSVRAKCLFEASVQHIGCSYWMSVPSVRTGCPYRMSVHRHQTEKRPQEEPRKAWGGEGGTARAGKPSSPPACS